MSFVGSMLGLGGGGSASGINYKPEKAQILNPATVDQATQAYNQSQTGLAQQLAFLTALQGQNGIGNQSSVFSQQQALANQYQNIANGTGPNPALQQLQNTTGQNVANQAALMASQRGAGANAGLIARQAGMQGANIQQQAAGQGAVLQAQQQLAGMQGLQQQQGMLGSLANQQVSQQAGATTGFNQAAQSEQQNLLNAIGNINNANVSAQNNVNNVSGALAGTVTQGQQGLLGGALGGLGSAIPLLGSAGGGGVSGASNIDTGAAGLVDAGGGASSIGGMARGGMVQHYAGGGDVELNINSSGPQSNAGRFLYSSAPSQSSAEEFNPAASSMTNTPNIGAASLKKGSSSGGGGGLMGGLGAMGLVTGIAAMESHITEHEKAEHEKGPRPVQTNGVPILAGHGIPAPEAGRTPTGFVDGQYIYAAQGSLVPGKAPVQGDSLKNDTVPAMLSPGEVVIPRHVMQSNDPVGNAAKFVAAVMAKNGRGLPR